MRAKLPAILSSLSICACAQPAAVVIEPLSVINWSPASGGFCIDTRTVVRATFSDDLNPDSVNVDSFFLLDAAGNVAADVTYDAAVFTVTLTPLRSLQFGTLYTTVVTSDVSGTARGRLPARLENSFITVPGNGCTPGAECQLPSDCPAPQVCASIGVCADDCVTDADCWRASCSMGACISTMGDGGPPAGDAAMGDPAVGDAAGDAGMGDATGGDGTGGGDAAAGDSAPGDSSPGDSAAMAGDTVGGDTAQGDVAGGDVNMGDAAAGDTNSGDNNSGDTVNGDTN